MDYISKFFKFDEKKTNYKTEIIAGITTFITMAYVLFVQPSAIVGSEGFIIDSSGVMITKEAILVMCAFVSGITTIIMGIYSNLPFALSCAMGVNFLLGGLIQSGEISFGTAMSIVGISGIIFVILSIFGIRSLVVNLIPKNVKVSIGAGIGFFLVYLGFKESGISNFTSGIEMGNFKSIPVILSLIGILIIVVLNHFKFKGAILISIISITIIGIPLGVTTIPQSIFSIPDFSTLQNISFSFDFSQILTVAMVPLIFAAFVGDFFSTLGTVIGLGSNLGIADKDGNFPGIDKSFLVDSVATVGGCCMGCTVVTTYVESSAGVESGGRSGFTSVVTGLIFLLTIFFSPLALIVPGFATAPALIYIGYLLIQQLSSIDFSDITEAFGPFITIVFTIFTASMSTGIAAGILAYVFVKLATGKFKDLNIGLLILSIPLILYFII
ncbi:MAG: NCS2 family permease [Oscillospiraceae bacterium]|nr:NCS2 family permease [Oscillospiraceae bacterium]